MTKNYHMGANFLIKALSGKWKISIICALSLHPFRYNELLHYENDQNNGRVSKKVLTEQLSQLEEDGIIKKKVYPEVPPKVIYSLTTIGKDIARLLVKFNYLGEALATLNTDEITFDITASEVKRLHEEYHNK